MAEQLVYLYRDGFAAMLSGVAAAVTAERDVRGVYGASSYRPLVFDETILIETDADRAHRFFDYVRGLRGTGAKLVLNSYLSEDVEAATHLCRVVKLVLEQGDAILDCYAEPSVNYLEKLSSKVGREAHKYKGLLRFSKLADGLLYAPFEPECNVLGHVARHFRDRLGATPWIVHDVKRDLALYWDGGELKEVRVDPGFTASVRERGRVPEREADGEEEYYRALWSCFFASITNPARANRRLQRQYMPRRYWKYLVES